MEGITRYAGKKHFTSTQHRSIFKEIIGPDSYILEANEKLEPELQSNNLLRIRSGMLCHHGFISEIKKNTYDEVTINNGTQGMKRIDLVVLRHTRNAETEVEDCEWVVIRGTPAASGPTVPEYTNGDINNGDLVDDCPVFKVELEGIQVVCVTKILNVLGGTLAGQKEEITELNGNSIIEVVTTSSGTAIKYANGLVEEFGRAICQNVNGNVAMASVNLPVSLDIQKPYAAFCSKDPMGNSLGATRVTTAASLSNSNSALFELQTPETFLGTVSDAYRTISWSVKGFWK